MGRVDLLKPLLFNYRDVMDIVVDRDSKGVEYYVAMNYDGWSLDLRTVDVVMRPTSTCFTSNLEDLLAQVDLYLAKVKIGEMYA